MELCDLLEDSVATLWRLGAKFFGVSTSSRDTGSEVIGSALVVLEGFRKYFLNIFEPFCGN